MNKTYQTISGDTWDLIAYKAMGDRKYMDKIIKCNLQYRNFFFLPAGILIDLPDEEQELAADLPPWVVKQL